MKQQLGHYDIVAELGRGGMGVVYKGHETSLNRYVAIKVLADALAHDQSVKERFLREARSMAALNDPHIIQIYFIGEDAGQTYFVMEFVDGESLGSVLKRESKLTPENAAKVIHQTAQGLATAHDKGVIHRDIKPGNLMLTSRGMVKIADFGIALSTQDFSKKLTSTGEFVGTPGYLSPEVCQGKPVDQRSDIFSLGIVLFECLAGRMPFTDESPLGLMLEVVKAQIPDVCSLNKEVDPELSRILSKMVAKEPADRYQSCQELVADLAKHPLVAKGGAITLQTRMSPAAATMLGQKTPASGQRPLPNTSPTPQPLHDLNRPTTPSSPQPVIGGHQSVLQPQAAANKSTALPWAIAAIALLGLGGGAYAMRDRIPMLQQLMGAPQNAANTAAPSATLGASNTVASTAAPSSATAAPAALAAATAPTNAAAAPTQTASAMADPEDPRFANNSATATAPVAATSSAPNAAAAQEPSGPAARASEVQPLKELVAARAAEAAVPPKQTIARATEPEAISTPRKPHIPTVAVVAGGDEVITEPAERAIEAALAKHGYHMIDQDTMPRVAHLLGGGKPNVAGMLEVLARNGRVDAVVVVHARPVGSEDIHYYGQSSTLNTTQLNVTAYAVEGQRKLSSGSEQVHFTSLNASDQAEEAIEGMMPQIEERLAEFLPNRKRE
jgi:serine/threonine-protein kinase